MKTIRRILTAALIGFLTGTHLMAHDSAWSTNTSGAGTVITDETTFTGGTPDSVVFIDGSSKFNTSSNFTYNGSTVAINGAFENTSTIQDTGGNTPIETYNSHLSFQGGGTNPFNLWGGLWIDGVYDDESTVSFSTYTKHGGPFFVRGRDTKHNQGFSFAGELNQLCISTNSEADCTSGIVHTKWDSDGLTAAQVGSNIPVLAGLSSRIDITSDGFGTVALSTGTVIHFFASAGLGGHPGRRFLMMNDFDPDLQILTVGNIIKASTSTAHAVLGGGTWDPVATRSLGGVSFFTSTATITMGGSTFGTPGNGYGTYSLFGEVKVCNANSTGGRTISIPNGGTMLNKGGATVTLSQGNSTASCAAWVGTALGVWLQLW
jgi:hypothetical protein